MPGVPPAWQWRGPRIRMSLPSFSGLTATQPNLLQYACAMHAAVRLSGPMTLRLPEGSKRGDAGEEGSKANNRRGETTREDGSTLPSTPSCRPSPVSPPLHPRYAPCCSAAMGTRQSVPSSPRTCTHNLSELIISTTHTQIKLGASFGRRSGQRARKRLAGSAGLSLAPHRLSLPRQPHLLRICATHTHTHTHTPTRSTGQKEGGVAAELARLFTGPRLLTIGFDHMRMDVAAPAVVQATMAASTQTRRWRADPRRPLVAGGKA